MDANLFQQVIGCSGLTAAQWATKLNTVMQIRGINTPDRVAMFMAQMSVESAKFNVFEENLNYSAQGLANTWPHRFATDPHSTPYIPSQVANSISRQPRKIANIVYANRMGNAGPETNDGWIYRGRGPKQITGKLNYSLLSTAVGIDYVTNPELLLDITHGATSAGWYWQSRDCNQFADKGDIVGCTMAVNGGMNGLADRKIAWTRARLAMGLQA